MVEADPILTQRVDALEQLAQSQVVEQVGELTERVAGLENARAAEKPHLATKADITRLEAQHIATREQIAAQSKHFDAQLIAQSERFDAQLIAQSKHFDAQLIAQSKQFDSKLETQTEQLLKRMEQRMNQQLIWIVGSGLAIAALLLSRLPA